MQVPLTKSRRAIFHPFNNLYNQIIIDYLWSGRKPSRNFTLQKVKVGIPCPMWSFTVLPLNWLKCPKTGLMSVTIILKGAANSCSIPVKLLRLIDNPVLLFSLCFLVFVWDFFLFVQIHLSVVLFFCNKNFSVMRL